MEYTTDTTWEGSIKISAKPYHSKPTDSDYTMMKFNPLTVSNSSFSNMIQQGYSFCPTCRSKSMVTESDYIAIDIDGSNIPMVEFVESVKYKPTIYYTTPSNGNESVAVEKYQDRDRKYRFRFIYSLSRSTNGVAQYNTAAEYIISENGLYDALPEKAVDKLEPNQLYNGSFGCEIHCTDLVYCLPDYIYSIEDKNEECEYLSFVTAETLNVFKRTRFREFLRWFVEHNGEPGVLTETPYVPSDIDGMLVPDGDYFRIRRKYGYYDKKRDRKVYYKWKDGENRHGKLFQAGLIIKHLNPHLCPDELFYGFVKVFYENFDIMNSDGSVKYTREKIINEFNAIMATDMDTNVKTVKHRSFEVDSLFCKREGISKGEAVGRINGKKRTEKKEMKYERIDTLYDPTIKRTRKEWVEFLNENGVDVTLPTFKNFLSEYGYTKSRVKKVKPRKVGR